MEVASLASNEGIGRLKNFEKSMRFAGRMYGKGNS